MAAKKREDSTATLIGRSTKGQTRPGRLRLFDPVVDAALHHRLTDRAGRPAVAVDIGVGSTPVTLVEWAQHLALGGAARVIGIERDASYVAQAQDELRATESGQCPLTSIATTDIRIEVVHGSFDHPVLQSADVVRVANVLRVYSDQQRQQAEDLLAARCLAGVRVVEITCDPEGHVGTALTSRVSGGVLIPESLAFGIDATAVASAGLAPIRFRDWLPRRYRRGLKPDSPVGRLLVDWMTSWRRVKNKESLEGLRESARLIGADANIAFHASSSAALIGWPLAPPGRQT